MSRATTGPHPTGYLASVTSTTTRVVGRRDGWIGRRGIERSPRTSDGGRASDRHDRGAGVGRPDCAASRATTFGSRRRVRVEAPPSGRGAAFGRRRRSSRGTARTSAHAMFGAVHRPPDPILAAVTSPGDIWADSGRKTASSSSWPHRLPLGVISGPDPRLRARRQPVAIAKQPQRRRPPARCRKTRRNAYESRRTCPSIPERCPRAPLRRREGSESADSVMRSGWVPSSLGACCCVS